MLGATPLQGKSRIDDVDDWPIKLPHAVAMHRGPSTSPMSRGRPLGDHCASGDAERWWTARTGECMAAALAGL